MSSAVDRRHRILESIASAAKLARRDPAEVELIAVSKTRTAEQIEELIEAGQRDFGESRVQEALAKWPGLLARHPHVRLHGIGRLQSNKAAEAVKLFDVIHSLDRASLLEALVADVETRLALEQRDAPAADHDALRSIYAGTDYRLPRDPRSLRAKLQEAA